MRTLPGTARQRGFALWSVALLSAQASPDVRAKHGEAQGCLLGSD